MKEKNKKNGLQVLAPTVVKRSYKTFRGIAFLTVLCFLGLGCKKDPPNTDTNKDRDYGYAKVVVDCAKKCHVSFGEPGKLNEFDVQADTANYYIRYQRNYNLDMNITPIDADQYVTLSVYSREEKQIFRNRAIRKANVVWNTKVVIP